MQMYFVMMKSQKSSFMVKDILGLRSEDDFSQLEHERLKAKCSEEMVIECQEENSLKDKSCTAKGIQCVIVIFQDIIVIFQDMIKNLNYRI